MVKTKNLMTYGTLALLALLVAGMLGYLPNIGLQAGGAGGTIVTGTNGGTTTINTAPCGQNPPQLTVSAFYTDVNNMNTPTSATTPAVLYRAGEQQAFFSSGATPNTTTTGLLACGDVIKAVFGNQSADIMSTGGTSYYRTCKDVTITKDAQSLSVELYRAGNASVTIANDSGVFGAKTQIDNESSLQAGGVYTQLTVRVRAPTTSGAVFGTDGWAMCTRYNSTDIAKYYPAGGVAVSIPSVKSTVSKDSVACYDMSGVGKLELGKSIDIPMTMQAVSGHTANNGTNQDIVLVDKAVSMLGSQCVVGFSKANDPTSDTGALDIPFVNITEIHSND